MKSDRTPPKSDTQLNVLRKEPLQEIQQSYISVALSDSLSIPSGLRKMSTLPVNLPIGLSAVQLLYSLVGSKTYNYT